MQPQRGGRVCPCLPDDCLVGLASGCLDDVDTFHGMGESFPSGVVACFDRCIGGGRDVPDTRKGQVVGQIAELAPAVGGAVAVSRAWCNVDQGFLVNGLVKGFFFVLDGRCVV